VTASTNARIRLGLLLVVGILVQTTLASDLRVRDVTPDFMLLLTICAGLAGGAESGAFFGFFAGLATDLWLTTPLGLSALTYCLVGFGVGALRANLLPDGRLLTPFTAFVATGGGVALFVVLGDLVGQSQLTAEGSSWLIRVAVVEAVFGAVLSVPVSWLVERAARGSVGAERLGRGRPTSTVTR
jgi:rod shape-determining protein MreD